MGLKLPTGTSLPNLRENLLNRLASLRTRLLLLVLLPGILVLLVLGWHGWKIVRQFETSEVQHARSLARMAQADLQQQINDGRQFLELLAQMAPLLHPERPAQCHHTLAEMQAHYPQYQNFGFIDRAGNMLCAGRPGKVNLSDRPFVKQVFKTGGFAFGPYQIGRLSNKPQIPLGYPVAASRQQPAALAFVTVSPHWFEKAVTLPAGMRLLVLDEHGIVIHNHPQGPVRPGEKYETFDLAALLAGRTEAETEATGRDGVPRHYLVQRVEMGENLLYLALGVPVEELRAGAWAVGRQVLAWLAALSLATLILAIWGIRAAVMDKLDRLMAAARRVAGGDLSTRAEIGPGRGELRQLATAFDGMMASLRSLRDLRGVILDAISEGIYGVDNQGKLIFINAAGARMLGHTPAELIGYPADGVIHRGLLTDLQGGEGGECHGTGSSLFWHKNGDSLPVEYTTTPLIESGRQTGTVVAFADVSERRAMETDLRRSEASFRSLFNSAPDAMLITNEAGVIEAVNQQAEQMFGYPRAELIGQPVELLVPQAQQARHAAHRRSYYGQPQTRLMGPGMELAARRKDGSTLPVAVSLSPLQVGDTLKVISAVRDITVPRQQRDELRRREQEMLTLTDNLPDLVVRFDREQRCLFANASVEKMTGLPRTALTGRCWTDLPALSGMAEICLAPVRQTLADGQAREVELNCPTPLGMRHFEARLVPEQGADGVLTTVLLIGRDVTGEKETAELIRRNEIRIARSQEIIRFGYWEWSPATGRHYWSDEIFQIFGQEPGKFDNTIEAFLAAVHPDDQERVRATVTTAVADGRHYQIEYRIVRPDGTERTILEIGDATHDAAGKLIGIEGPLFDITDHKHLQDTIRELKQALEQRVAQQTAQWAPSAHDLQLPLRTINSLAQILSNEEKECLSRIQLPADGADD